MPTKPKSHEKPTHDEDLHNCTKMLMQLREDGFFETTKQQQKSLWEDNKKMYNRIRKMNVWIKKAKCAMSIMRADNKRLFKGMEVFRGNNDFLRKVMIKAVLDGKLTTEAINAVTEIALLRDNESTALATQLFGPVDGNGQLSTTPS